MPNVPGSIADHDIKKNNYCLKQLEKRISVSRNYVYMSGPENFKNSAKKPVKLKENQFQEIFLNEFLA